MMKEGNSILVHLVEPKPVGYRFERTRKSWPLHITLVPWFFADSEQMPAFTSEITAVCEKITPPVSRVGNRELFGPNHDIPVNVLSDVLALKGLHIALLDIVDRTTEGLQVPSAYVGAQYRPHITRHNGMGATQGDVIAVDSVALVNVDASNICTVAQTFAVGNHAEAAA
jgi:hypothetical protein